MKRLRWRCPRCKTRYPEEPAVGVCVRAGDELTGYLVCNRCLDELLPAPSGKHTTNEETH